MRTIQATLLVQIPELAANASGDEARVFFSGIRLSGTLAVPQVTKLVPIATTVLDSIEAATIKAALDTKLDPQSRAAIEAALDRVTVI